MMKEFWNERFGRDEYIYGTRPNSFFKTELNKIGEKGTALFPLEGEGRNACYAAQQGWNVEAFDFSAAGKEKALRLCKAHKASMSYEISKAENFQFKENTYDLVVLIYAHLNPELREQFHKKAITSLKPGGKIILEAFHPKQLKDDYKSGGPKNPDMLYALDLIKKDFQSLTDGQGKELEIDLKEGAFHNGKGFVTRFTGVK